MIVLVEYPGYNLMFKKSLKNLQSQKIETLSKLVVKFPKDVIVPARPIFKIIFHFLWALLKFTLLVRNNKSFSKESLPISMFLFTPPLKKQFRLLSYFALKTSLGCLLLTFHVTLGFVSLLACGGLCLLPLSPCGCCLLCCFLLKHGPVKCVVILVVQSSKKKSNDIKQVSK